jgi:hypothetical protein
MEIPCQLQLTNNFSFVSKSQNKTFGHISLTGPGIVKHGLAKAPNFFQ